MISSFRSSVPSLIVVACLSFSSYVSHANTLIFESKEQVSKPAPPPPVQAPPVNNNASQQAITEMYFLVEQLKQEVLELRGTVEEQSFRIKNLEENGKRRYKDLDQRILSLSKKQAQYSGAVSTTSDSKSISTKPLSADKPVSLNGGNVNTSVNVTTIVPVQAAVTTISADEKAAYDQAYSFVRERKFEQAIDELHEFVEKYPDSDLTGNAYYWLGEVYLVIPQLEQAKQSFQIVLQSFPNHRKLADSIFKLAVTYDRLLDEDNSEKYLKMVQARFPNSTAAKLAENYKIER